MPLVSTTAFILRLDPLSEKDLVAALLTKDSGLLRAVVKGARGRSKRAAALQLLTEVAVTIYRREGQELGRVESIEIVRSSFALACRPESAMLLPYVAESVMTFVPDSEPGGEVYRLTRHVLDALEEGIAPLLVTRYFEVWMLRFAGLLPEGRACALCGEPLGTGSVRLDPEIPGFVCAACAGRGSIPVAQQSLSLLQTIRQTRLTEWPALGNDVDGAVLEEIESLTREVRRRFLGHELKSHRFLRSLG
jgi:DNA repair protein RecO (recombination protein O)